MENNSKKDNKTEEKKDFSNNRRRGLRKNDAPKDEFEQKLVEVRRVTRVTGGGKQLSFRAAVVVGDGNGRVGVGAAKGKDVAGAVNKAVNQAKKSLVNVQIINGTIAHSIDYKFKAAKVMLKPAKQGSGVIAGGAVRMVLELAGVQNIVSKIRGSNNKLNNIKATVMALDSLLKRPEKKQAKQDYKVKKADQNKDLEKEDKKLIDKK